VLNKGGRLPNNITERAVVEMWQRLMNKAELTTVGGELVKIIYPGRKNDYRGADFRDAVIATSQGIKRGDIEVHVKSTDWQAHRHHQDPAYNRVILHVVLKHSGEATSNLHNGEKVPVLAIDKYIGDGAKSAHSSTPCTRTVKGLAGATLTKLLDRAGEERFSAKAIEFQAELTQVETRQSLYQGIMGALGYAKNKPPMLKLAKSLPLATLHSMTQDKIAEQECLARLQALLLGTAGLLPSQRQQGLIHIYNTLCRQGKCNDCPLNHTQS
jgi:hypothetical protein